MSLTLNDFRNVLGSVNDGNVVFDRPNGENAIKKANYGRIHTRGVVATNENDNKLIRAALMNAITASEQGKIMSDAVLNQLKARLGIQENGTSNVGVDLTRRELKEIIDQVDHVSIADYGKRMTLRLEQVGIIKDQATAAVMSLCAEQIKNFGTLEDADSLLEKLPKNALGMHKDELKKFIKTNFRFIKMRTLELYALSRITNSQSNMKIGACLMQVLEETAKKVRNHIDLTFHGETIPLELEHGPRAVPENARDAFARSGAADFEAKLDAAFGQFTASARYPLNSALLRNIVENIKDSFRARFTEVFNAAQGDAAEYVRSNLMNAFAQKVKTLNTLANDLQAMGPKTAETYLCKLSRAIYEAASMRDAAKWGAAEFENCLFEKLAETASTFSLRTRFAAAVVELFPNQPVAVEANTAKILAAFDAIESARDGEGANGLPPADVAGLKSYYKELVSALANGEKHAPNAVKNHVRAMINEMERAEIEAARRLDGDFAEMKRLALTLQDENEHFQPANNRSRTELQKVVRGSVKILREVYPDEVLKEHGLVNEEGTTVVPADDVDYDSEAGRAALAGIKELVLAKKEDFKFNEKYIRFGLDKVDSNIRQQAQRNGDKSYTPMKNLLKDGLFNINEIGANDAAIMSVLLGASISSYRYGLKQAFSTVMKVDFIQDLAKELIDAIQASNNDRAKGRIPNVNEAINNEEYKAQPEIFATVVQAAFDETGLHLPGFKTVNPNEILTGLAAAGMPFSEIRTPKGYLKALALMTLANNNPTGVKGLDEYCKRMLGKAATEVTYTDVINFVGNPPADPISTLSGAKKDVMMAFTGATNLKSLRLDSAGRLAVLNAARTLASGAAGASVTLNIAGVNGVVLSRTTDGGVSVNIGGNVIFKSSHSAVDLVHRMEDIFVTTVGEDQSAAGTVQQIIQGLGDETPILRQRELAVKAIVSKLGITSVELASIPTNELKALAADVVTGRRNREDVVRAASAAFNSVDMVEMHEKLEAESRANPHDVNRKVKITIPSDVRSLEERRLVTLEKDVRNLAADLLMNSDTWAQDGAQANGAQPQPGARLLALRNSYGPELANIANNNALLESIPPAFRNEMSAIIRDFTAIPAADTPENRQAFAAIEARLDGVASRIIDTLQAKVREMFQARPNDDRATWKKSFGEMNGTVGIDTSTNSGKFVKKVLDGYFSGSTAPDKRKMLAAVMRNTNPASTDTKIVTELLKGAGPLLQKILQGLPIESFSPETQAALADMKSRLPSIPLDAVKAQMYELVKSSGGKITSIEVKRSLGAASVGQAFLCSIKTPDSPVIGREAVVKVLRPTAQTSVIREKEVIDTILNAPEFAQLKRDFNSQYASILKELDFTLEAENVKTGVVEYDMPKIKEGAEVVNYANIHSMRLMDVSDPTMSTMILEKAPGKTVDGFLRDETEKVMQYAGRTDPMSVINLRMQIVDSTNKILKQREKVVDLVKVWLNQVIFTNGFFHGDMHAGNVMIDEANLTVIDFGNATRMTHEEQKLVVKMLACGINGDADVFRDTVSEFFPKENPAKAQAKAAYDRIAGDIKEVLMKGTGNDVIGRIQGAFALLQRAELPLPGVINNFFQSFSRLGGILNAMDAKITELENIGSTNNASHPDEDYAEFDTPGEPHLIATLEGMMTALETGEGVREAYLRLMSLSAKDVSRAPIKLSTLMGDMTRANANRMVDYLKRRFAVVDYMEIPGKKHYFEVELPAAINAYFNAKEANQPIPDLVLRQLDRGFTNHFADHFTGAVSDIIGKKGVPEKSFSQITSDYMFERRMDLVDLAKEALGFFAAMGVGMKMLNSLNAAEEHDNRLNSARERLEALNTDRPAEERLKKHEMNNLVKVMRDFTSPGEHPLRKSDWHNDQAKIDLFLEMLENDVSRLKEVFGDELAAKHLKFAFELYNAAEDDINGDNSSMRDRLNANGVYEKVLARAEQLDLANKDQVKLALSALKG